MNIFIVPVRFSNAWLLKNILVNLSKMFTSQVQLLELNLELENFLSKERGQYYSTGVIARAMELTNNVDGKIILITDVDIFVPVLTFVFGEAQLDGKHSIVSVCRLHEEFYSGKSNNNLLLERTMKEILHELGHNFGLRHCTDWDCVMHSSPGIEEVDIKGNGYCRSCADHVEAYKYFCS